MQEERQLQLSRSKIGENLSTGEWRKELRRLDLDNETVVHNDVDSLLTDPLALVKHVHPQFSINKESATLYLLHQSSRIDRFE